MRLLALVAALPVALAECMVATGAVFTCATMGPGGSIECWGDPSNGKTSPPPTPSGGWSTLVGSGYAMCGILATNGTIECWGTFSDVQGQPTGQATPPPGKRFSELAVGGVHSCAIEAGTGELHCFGYNADGRSSPPTGTGYSAIASTHHSCALRSGSVVCWGPSGNGQTIGPNVASWPTYTDVCVGTLFGCALQSDGFVQCWGDNAFGQLINNVSQQHRFESLSCGSKYACGVRLPSEGGRAECWGYNDKGRATPSAVLSTSAVSASVMHTCSVIRDDAGTMDCVRRLVCVGDNFVDEAAVPCRPGSFVGPAVEGGACTLCRAGFFQASVLQTTCDACAVGSFSYAGAAACDACLLGHFCFNQTMKQCAPGTSASSRGMVSCVPCSPGYFAPSPGTADCSECPAGHSCAKGSVTPAPCNPGTYATAGLVQCISCSAGLFSPAAARTVCETCPALHFCPSASINPSACPAGSSSASVGSPSCTTCSAGTYANASATPCRQCPPGSRCPEAGTIYPTVCTEIAQFCAGPGAIVASPVPAGSYRTALDGSRVIACPAGYFCRGGEAIACAAGFYTVSKGAPTCSSCAPARFAAATASTACYECPEGFYCPSNATVVPIACSADNVFCAAGLSSPTPITDGSFKVDDTEMRPCTPGSFCKDGRSALCDPGRYATLSTSTICLPCLEGSYAFGAGNEKCSDCVAGEAMAVPSATSCNRCEPGKYSPQDRASGCMPCSDGTFSQPQQSACFDCPLNGITCSGATVRLLDNWWFQPEHETELPFSEETQLYECLTPDACVVNASTLVVGCRDGHIGPMCAVCDVGHVMKPEGCSYCAGGTTQVPAALAFFIAMILLSWFIASLIVLHRPDNGFKWLSAKKMAMRWRRRVMALREANARAAMRKRLGLEPLPKRRASIVASAAALSIVSAAAVEHANGIDSDGDDAHEESKKREVDDEEDGSGGILGDIFMLSDIQGAVSDCYGSIDLSAALEKFKCIIDEISSLKSKIMGQVKLLLGFLQITGGISMTFDVPWDKNIVIFLGWLKRFQFSLSDVLSLLNPCALETTFYQSFLGTVLAIPTCTFILFLSVLASLGTSMLRRVLRRALQKYPAQYSKSNSKSSATSSCSYRVRHKLAKPLLESRHTSRSVRTRFAKLMNWIAFILYPSICAKSFSMWKCDNVNGSWYLREDFQVQCFEGPWIFFAILSVCSILIYVIGIPLASLLILVRAKKEGTLFATVGNSAVDIKTFERHRRTKNKYGGLYMQYDHRCWWFEIIVMTEKMILTGALVLVGDGSATQIILGILVCFVFLILLGNLHPYPEHRDDVLAQAAQAQLFVTLFAALTAKVKMGGIYEAELFSWGVIGLNVATIALAMFIMLSNLPCTAGIADIECLEKCCGSEGKCSNACASCASATCWGRKCATRTSTPSGGDDTDEAVLSVELRDVVVGGSSVSPSVMAARRRRRSSLTAEGGLAGPAGQPRTLLPGNAVLAARRRRRSSLHAMVPSLKTNAMDGDADATNPSSPGVEEEEEEDHDERFQSILAARHRRRSTTLQQPTAGTKEGDTSSFGFTNPLRRV